MEAELATMVEIAELLGSAASAWISSDMVTTASQTPWSTPAPADGTALRSSSGQGRGGESDHGARECAFRLILGMSGVPATVLSGGWGGKGGTVARFELTIPMEEARLRGFEEHDPRGRLVAWAWSQAGATGMAIQDIGGDPGLRALDGIVTSDRIRGRRSPEARSYAASRRATANLYR